MTRKISFEDIRQGDRIQAHFKPEYGVTTIREGVAHELTEDTWVTEGFGLVAAKDWVESITLLERPSPQEPEGLGKIIRYGEDTYVSVRAVPGTLRWCMTPRGGRESGLFYCWSDFEPERIEIL